MSCPHQVSDAAYVLGALSPGERAEYEAHLTQCPECAAAVSKLAPIPGLLRRVDPAALRPAEPGPGRLATLLRAVAATRRRETRRRRLQLAAAALAIAVVAVTGSALWYGTLHAPAERPASAVAMEPVTPTVPVAAEVSLTPTTGGTEVWMTCWYPPTAYEIPPRTFRLVAIGADGSVEQVGSWRAGPGERVSLTSLTRFTTDLRRLEVRDEAGGTLLTHRVG